MKNETWKDFTKQDELDVPELLRGVEISVAINGPYMYMNAIKNENCSHGQDTSIEQTFGKA